jgi:ParB-like chromosome segregation protein Spo0J
MPVPDMPVSNVMWVPMDQVTPNDYNPNKVALQEMALLRLSIMADGFTQPIVTIWDDNQKKYVIVDGFHRYYVMLMTPELQARTHRRLPVVVIDKPLAERMASTVRHNRARGKHTINGMANMVFQMLEEGLTDAQVCNELGLEPDEILKLKHVTGFSKLYQDAEYSRSWVTPNQIEVRKRHAEATEVTP